MNITIRTRNGFEQELREIDLLSIDGRPYDQIIPPSLTNHEHRLQVLEEIVSGLLSPGLFKGVLTANIQQFEIGMFTKAAHALAQHVKNPTRETILPTMFDTELVDVIAKTVTE